jgi:predicted metal-dependent phosphoesterase TrpH
MVDLHMHSLYSDGTFSVLELIKRAKEKGIKILSLTDHDTVEGLQEAKKECIENNIKFINGIEISTEYNGKEVHILGYFIDEKNESLIRFSEEMKQARITRNEKTIKILNSHGIEITKEDTYREAEGSIISRTHLARALMTKGYVKDVKEAFSRYVGSDGIAYVPKSNLTPFDGIKIIKDGGGLAFLAHPKLIGLEEEAFLRLVKDMKDNGLDGIETYYSLFSKADIEYFEKTAEKFSLIKSAGSDFHGANRKGVDIGDNFSPEELYYIWDELYEQKNKY